MQDDNNFETIINTWRRLADAELAVNKPPALYTAPSMSGDSSNHETQLKKKDDESVLLVPEDSRHKSVPAASSAAVVAPEPPPEIVNTSLDEKQEFVKQKGDDEEAAGDKDDNRRDDNEYSKLHTEKDTNKELKYEKEKLGDNVDSVFLRSGIPHKAQSDVSTAQEEEDCGIKCLYYTLQCCDCVLM